MERACGCFELIHAVDYTVWVAGGEPQEIYGICGSDADIAVMGIHSVGIGCTDRGQHNAGLAAEREEL